MSSADAWYFSRGYRNTRQANIGNTVLINRGDNIWFLGYVQDIEGDQLFIDMDCSQYPPSWIHSRHIWQHHLISFDRKLESPSALDIHVALRNQAQGPYIFRAAQLLILDGCSGENLYLCCIMDVGGNRQIVHRWQIVAMIPDKEPSVFGRLDTIPIVKHVVHSAKAYSIQGVDEYDGQISQFVGKAFHQNGTAYRAADDDRFFVRTGKATVTFVFLNNFHCLVVRNRSSRALSTSLDKLCTSFDRFLELQNLTQLRERTGPTSFGSHIIGPVSVETSDSLRCALSWDLLSQILWQLDFHSQLKAKRVCLPWSLALTESAASDCVEIDFRNITHKKTFRSDTEGYVIAYALDQAVTSRTRTLLLTCLHQRVCPFRGTKLISSLLRIRGTHLNTIVINKCKVFAELYHPTEDATDLQPDQLGMIMAACRRLVVLQYTIDQPLFCCWNTDLPTIAFRKARSRRNPLPRITISRMTLDCSPIEHCEINRRISIALERCCRPVDDDVREQFRELHAQWVRAVPYPDGWTTFKYVLQQDTAPSPFDECCSRSVLNCWRETVVNGDISAYVNYGRYFASAEPTIVGWSTTLCQRRACAG